MPNRNNQPWRRFWSPLFETYTNGSRWGDLIFLGVIEAPRMHKVADFVHGSTKAWAGHLEVSEPPPSCPATQCGPFLGAEPTIWAADLPSWSDAADAQSRRRCARVCQGLG